MSFLRNAWLGCIACIGLSVLPVAAEGTIEWYRTDLPPSSIPSGPYKDQGHSDLTQKLLTAALPTYRHVEVIANFSRIAQDIKAKPNACSAALLKTPEREPFIEFSLPYRALIPVGLIVQRQDMAQIQSFITKNHTIRLDALLDSGNFTVGYTKGRSYGEKIDQLVKGKQGSPAVYERTGADQFEGLLTMLTAGNRGLGGVLGYPDETRFFSQKLGIGADRLRYLSVEGSPPYILGYVGCSKSEFGKSVIAQINRIIEKQRDGQLLKFYENWMDDETRDRYPALVKKAFQESH